MNGLEEKKRRRFLYLQELYNALGGRTEPANIPEEELRKRLGWTPEQVEDASEYLKNEGLIKYAGGGPLVPIQHAGVIEYEKAVEHPEQPTHYFPAVNIINVHGNMTHSQMQVGSHGSSQQIVQGFDCDAVLALVAEVRQWSAQQHESTRAQLDGILVAIESIAKQPPQQQERGILKGLLGSAKAIIEGTGGPLLASKFAPVLGVI
jgi:hypothetical protein